MIDYFKGNWELYRHISDGTHMQGQAILTPHHTMDTLYYKESGHFYTPSGVFDFFQDYLFMLTPLEKTPYNSPEKGHTLTHPMRLSLYFLEKKSITPSPPHNVEKGRLFMTFDSHGQGMHTCKNDVYKGFFHHEQQNTFQLSFNVNGPRKNYSMCTLYKRPCC